MADPVAHMGHLFQQVAVNVQQSPLGKHIVGIVGQWKRNASNVIGGHEMTSGRRIEARGRRIVVPPRDRAFAAILPGDSIAEQVITTGFLNFLNLYNSALILRLVLTWFPSVPEQIAQPLSTVCDPYLNLFRGIIPPLGGTLDLSPILAFVTLNFFTSTAAALPCEVGPDGRTPVVQQQQQGWQQWLQPSRYEQMWARRVQAQRALAAAGSETGGRA